MRKGRIVILGFGLAMLGMLTPFVAADEVPRMAKERLKALLDAPDVVVLDVRRNKNWNESEKKIKGAIRENPAGFESWAHKYQKDKTLVLYCA